ncbi:uncharacterized protein C20orf85-like [Cyprinodon tularosa]|uniref:uncharacterized protein C20orf85-like n=1 Tax=Cyprinodon tularosa TaxID=77115 RepID=UPI0018E28D2E|nr:uncharacterized protein C20orf85-like [Cyprinodon tularosa]
MENSQRPSEPVSYVNQDEFWKQCVKKEWICHDSWPKKWGFMTESYKEYQMKSMKLKEALNTELSPDQTARPLTPPPVHVGPSSAVPATTQGFIGWRSHIPIDKYNTKHYRRKGFGGPLDGCNEWTSSQ